MKDIFLPNLLVIPMQLVRDKNLQQVERLLYGVIYWYQHLKDGRCFASNETMAGILGTSPRVIQNSLTSLEKYGYITRIYKDSKKRNRLEIRGLIAFGNVSPVGDRKIVYEPQVTNVPPTGDRAYEPQVTRVRIGNKNIKKNSKSSASAASTPGEYARRFFGGEGIAVGETGMWVEKSTGLDPQLILRELLNFQRYWTEPTKSGKKMRWELQPTFDVRRRLVTWFGNVQSKQGKQRAGMGTTV